jgi:hypothetical protein
MNDKYVYPLKCKYALHEVHNMIALWQAACQCTVCILWLVQTSQDDIPAFKTHLDMIQKLYNIPSQDILHAGHGNIPHLESQNEKILYIHIPRIRNCIFLILIYPRVLKMRLDVCSQHEYTAT